MKLLMESIYAVFVCVSLNAKAADTDTLRILTNNSYRYWNDIGNNRLGICFYKNGDYEEFIYDKQLISCNEEKVCRYNTSSCDVKSFMGMGYRIKDGELELFYKQNHCSVFEKYSIIELTDTIVCLANERKTIIYHLASDQATQIETKPELHKGYELARIQDPNAMNSIIDSVLFVCRNEHMDWPSSFQVNVLLRIDNEGFVCNAEFQTGSIDRFPGKGSERFFYSLLLDKIKHVHFIPARNEREAKSFFCECLMPIKYEEPLDRRGRF